MGSHRGKPEDAPVIAWFDLETTGSRVDDRIIQVGFVLTDRELNEVEAHEYNVKPDNYWDLRERMKPEVVDMHTKNGLLGELLLGINVRPIEEVDVEIASILRLHNGTNHVPLAGSGVAHFDRRYIRAEMPKTDDRLSYWAYDIGSMRRLLHLFELPIPSAELHKAKTHRALDDVREHIAETRAIRDRLQEDRELAWRYTSLE